MTGPLGGTRETLLAPGRPHALCDGIRVLFTERGCALCHYSTGDNGAWDTGKILADAVPPKGNPARVVAPVKLPVRFLPNAVFDHASHRGHTCENCHTVAAAVSIAAS